MLHTSLLRKKHTGVLRQNFKDGQTAQKKGDCGHIKVSQLSLLHFSDGVIKFERYFSVIWRKIIAQILKETAISTISFTGIARYQFFTWAVVLNPHVSGSSSIFPTAFRHPAQRTVRLLKRKETAAISETWGFIKTDIYVTALENTPVSAILDELKEDPGIDYTYGVRKTFPELESV